MKRRSIVTLLAIAAMAIGMTAYAEGQKKEDAKTKKQTHCPVMRQNPINKNLYVDVKGKRLYVCCPGCIGKIKADPDKYIKEMVTAGVELEKAPKKEDAKAESKSEE